MVKPSIAELSQNDKYNRYTLVIAAAKGARYVIDKENYEKEHPEIEQYKVLTTGKKTEKTERKSRFSKASLGFALPQFFRQ